MTSDMDILIGKSYKELLQEYNTFSLGYMGNDIKSKFALISLICYLTYKSQEKKPDVTHYAILKSLTKDFAFPDEKLKALAVVCNDFGYCCKDFPTFDIPTKNIIPTVKKMLHDYVPF